MILLIENFVSAQGIEGSIEKYGRTLNLGLGVGYYGYIGHSIPVLHSDYELDVAKSFTLAPFVSFYSIIDNYQTQNIKKYYYHETVIPVGVKATYYFDDLLQAGSNWDFYMSGSAGFAFIYSYWDDGYAGDRGIFRNANPLFLDLHAGIEYHFNKRLGMFFDLSSGVSTIGIAIHSF